MRRPLLFSIILFTVILPPLFGSDRQIALAYLETIEQLWPQDEVRAFELIDDALTYDDTLSGLWFYRGLYELEQEDLSHGLVSLERALDADDWEKADFDYFLDTLFPLYVRLGKWESVLEGEKRVAYHRVNRKEILLAAGWADYFTGNRQDAARRARAGVDLYPGDWRFYPLIIASGEEDRVPSLLRYFGDDPMVMGQIFDRLYTLQSLPLELKVWYEAQNDEIGAFLSLEEELLRGGSSTGNRLEQYLVQWEPKDLYRLIRLVHLSTGEDRDRINRYLVEERGSFFYDGDGDGYNELFLTEEKRLKADRDRDGLWDRELSLDREGSPIRWAAWDHGDSSSYTYNFYEWPYVEEVLRTEGDSSQTFSYLYPRFSLNEGESFPERVFLDETNPAVTEWVEYILADDIHSSFSSLLTECRLIEERKGGHLARRYFLKDGEVFALEEDLREEGIMSRQVLLDQGRIVAARRDLDSDGRFDLFEYYEDGIWQGYALNRNGEGGADYYEDWTFIPLKIWDYDRDRFMDGYLAGPYGEQTVTVIPHRDDPRDVGDFIAWERKFEAQWYR
ncbi:MAG: hypothetical protein PQJ60_10935 [Spirochaetales bacterium]|nr:hypothetical protein [Spirochaetales bacterium]